jgi:hypothetical protein
MLVPKWLLDPIAGAPERSRRLLVTGWVLSSGPGDDERALREAARLWPPDPLKRPGRCTVLSILLELEQLGVVSDVREAGGDFEVMAGDSAGQSRRTCGT